MSDKEKALDIIVKKKVNVALLLECFEMPDDPFLLKYQPDERKGLYNYNRTNEPGEYWREPLTIREYLFLLHVLKGNYEL